MSININDPLIVQKSILITAPLSTVWKALITPEIIKQYLFGTETITDWKKGSSIIFQGEWEGKPYKDKGVILDIETEKFIRYTYWSSFSGTEDAPENYANVSYELYPTKEGTELTITQDGSKTAEARDHSSSNWGQVLENLKKIVEK